MWRSVLLAWWFTWHIFSADGTRTLIIDSDLYSSEDTCETARKEKDRLLIHLGISFETHKCENQDRMPR